MRLKNSAETLTFIVKTFKHTVFSTGFNAFFKEGVSILAKLENKWVLNKQS